MSDEQIKRLAKFMGWTPAPNPYGKDNTGDWLFTEPPLEVGGVLAYKLAPVRKLKDWNPYERIQDAWMLVEKAQERGFSFSITGACTFSSVANGIVVEFDKSVNPPIRWKGQYVGHADTSPAAICQAILKLMEGRTDE